MGMATSNKQVCVLMLLTLINIVVSRPCSKSKRSVEKDYSDVGGYPTQRFAKGDEGEYYSQKPQRSEVKYDANSDIIDDIKSRDSYTGNDEESKNSEVGLYFIETPRKTQMDEKLKGDIGVHDAFPSSEAAEVKGVDKSFKNKEWEVKIQKDKKLTDVGTPNDFSETVKVEDVDQSFDDKIWEAENAMLDSEKQAELALEENRKGIKEHTLSSSVELVEPVGHFILKPDGKNDKHEEHLLREDMLPDAPQNKETSTLFRGQIQFLPPPVGLPRGPIPVRAMSFGGISFMPPAMSVNDRLPMLEVDAQVDGSEIAAVEDVKSRVPKLGEKSIYGHPLELFGIPFRLPPIQKIFEEVEGNADNLQSEQKSKVLDVLGRKFLLRSKVSKVPTRDHNSQLVVRLMSVEPIEDLYQKSVKGIAKETGPGILSYQSFGANEHKDAEGKPLHAGNNDLPSISNGKFSEPVSKNPGEEKVRKYITVDGKTILEAKDIPLELRQGTFDGRNFYLDQTEKVEKLFGGTILVRKDESFEPDKEESDFNFKKKEKPKGVSLEEKEVLETKDILLELGKGTIDVKKEDDGGLSPEKYTIFHDETQKRKDNSKNDEKTEDGRDIKDEREKHDLDEESITANTFLKEIKDNSEKKNVEPSEQNVKTEDTTLLDGTHLLNEEDIDLTKQESIFYEQRKKKPTEEEERTSKRTKEKKCKCDSDVDSD